MPLLVVLYPPLPELEPEPEPEPELCASDEACGMFAELLSVVVGWVIQDSESRKGTGVLHTPD